MSDPRNRAQFGLGWDIHMHLEIMYKPSRVKEITGNNSTPVQNNVVSQKNQHKVHCPLSVVKQNFIQFLVTLGGGIHVFFVSTDTCLSSRKVVLRFRNLCANW